MESRREVISAILLSLTAGCTGTTPESDANTDGSETVPSPVVATATETDDRTPVYRFACANADADAPPVQAATTPAGSEYPSRPSALRPDTVRQFLTEFERAYARNETLDEQAANSVTVAVRRVEVESVDGGVEAADDGFLGHANVQVMYTQGEGQRTVTGDIKYTVNYFLSADAVYRVESDIERVDPRDRDEPPLVACFE